MLFFFLLEEASIAYGKLKPKITNEDYSWLISEKDNRVKRAFINSLKHSKSNTGLSTFLQSILHSDTSYYLISDAFRVLTNIDSSSARIHLDSLLNVDSHNDVIRKSALSYFGFVKNYKNYNRLKSLVEYGKFSWSSRPTIITELGKYQISYPKTLSFLLGFLNDNDRFVRMAVIKQIGMHGSKAHFNLLDSAVESDPVLSINARSAKENILKKKSAKHIKSDKDLNNDLRRKLNEIKNILNN